MNFLKNLFVSLLLLLLGVLASILILTEGLKTVILKPTLAYEIIDDFPLQEVAPELLGQYITLSSTPNEIPFEFSTDDIGEIIGDILTDELELYLKTQLKNAVTKFYAFMNSETDELNIEISLPDITEEIFKAMPLDQIIRDFELPLDVCEGGGTDCINFEDLNMDDLGRMMEKFMSGEEVLGTQDVLTENMQSPIPTSIIITTENLSKEVLQIRDVIQSVKYSGLMLGSTVLFISLLVIVLKKWKGLISVGSTFIATALSFLLLSVFSNVLETFITNLLKSQIPFGMEGVFDAVSNLVLQISEFLMQEWTNYSLMLGGVGIILVIVGIILKRKYNQEDTVSKIPESELTKIQAVVEPEKEEINPQIPTEKEIIRP